MEPNLKTTLGEMPSDRLSKLIRRALLGCYIFAALRVLFYTSGFPVFGSTDEQAHFDLVLKYSAGEIPSELKQFSTETTAYMALYQTTEYINNPAKLPGGIFPKPRWKPSGAIPSDRLRAETLYWTTYLNHESLSPPFYYVVAAFWHRLGNLFLGEQLYSIYWIRHANVLFILILIAISAKIGKELFPDRLYFRLALPIGTAFWPQDAFYCIQSDVLSPLCFGIAFLYFVRLWKSDFSSIRFAWACGLGLAASALTKYSNAPLLAVTGIFILSIVACRQRRNYRSARTKALATLALTSGAPIAMWLARSAWALGDITSSRAKIAQLGWTSKSILHWWPHPLFTARGLWRFSSDLCATFWHGELAWHEQPLAWASLDVFYVLSSLLLLGSGVYSAIRFGPTYQPWQRTALYLSAALIASSVLFLAYLSVSYDFGDCYYPSRDYPYFTSGRLLAGAWVPFLLLYVAGLDRMLTFTQNDSVKLLILVCIGITVTICQFYINLPVLNSEYSLLH